MTERRVLSRQVHRFIVYLIRLNVKSRLIQDQSFRRPLIAINNNAHTNALKSFKLQQYGLKLIVELCQSHNPFENYTTFLVLRL